MRIPLLIVFSISLILQACEPAGSSGPTGPDPDGEADLRIEIVGGAMQEGRQSEVLGEAIQVRVERSDGSAEVGVGVTGRVVEGDGVFPLNEGSTSAATRTTNSDGIAEFIFRLGMELDHRIEFTVAGEHSVSVLAEAVARYVYRIPDDAGDGWPVSGLNTADPFFGRLIDGVEEIRAGTYPEIHSLLIVQSDSLRFEEYWSGNDSFGRIVEWDRDLPHEAMSATKSFRSALVGIAIDLGYISGVDQRIMDFFPEHAAHFDAVKSRITVQDVLTMSSGIEWDETGVAAGGTDNSLARMYARPLYEWTEYVLSQPAAYDPGTVYVYNTGASIMLGDIVQRASGMPFTEFVRTYLQEPLEMTRPPGVGFTTGATIVPRDLARLGQVYLRRGMWKETRVVSESYVEDSFVERFVPGPGLGYGYQWWMRTLETDAASYRVRYASGNGGQFIIVVDDLATVIAFTGGNFGLARMDQVFPFVEFYVLPILE